MRAKSHHLEGSGSNMQQHRHFDEKVKASKTLKVDDSYQINKFGTSSGSHVQVRPFLKSQGCARQRKKSGGEQDGGGRRGGGFSAKTNPNK